MWVPNSQLTTIFSAKNGIWKMCQFPISTTTTDIGAHTEYCIREGHSFSRLDCKTVRSFEYLNTCEQSNKRSGTRLKTESATGERR